MDIYPDQMAREWLEAQGIDWDQIANEHGGIKAAQLEILREAAKYFGVPELVENARATIDRVSKSAALMTARAMKEGRAVYARNLKNTIIGTLSNAITEQYLEESASPDQMLKWLPSDAEEIDPHHALNYGKVMKVSTAQTKELGTRYGCKCGFQFLRENATIKQLNKKFSS